jgi:uncharacterized protein YceK
MTTPTRMLFLCLSLGALTLAGCTTVGSDTAPTDEAQLAAAGFRAQPADTPERQKALAAMPPLKMVRRSKNGNVFYTFADPFNCKCIYAGSQSSYEEYVRLSAQRQAETLDRRDAAMAAENEEMGWDPVTGLRGPVWGPLGP